MDFVFYLDALIPSLKDEFFAFPRPESCALLMYNGWGKSDFVFVWYFGELSLRSSSTLDLWSGRTHAKTMCSRKLEDA